METQALNQAITSPLIDFFHQYWWLLAIIIALAIGTQLLNTKSKKTLSGKYKPGEVLPFELAGSILTNIELDYYRALVKAIDGKAVICTKVRLADFLIIPPNTNNQRRFFNMISSKHIDFLICESVTMMPIFAIELDDPSHSKPKNRERDVFKNNAFYKAGIELIRVPVASKYNVKKIAQDMMPRIEDARRQDWSD